MKIDNSAWRDLPNAALIDWVLQSVKDNLKSWDAARDATRGAALNAARNAVLDAAPNEAAPALAVVTALIAYDDCEQYLAIAYEELKVYAILSERPQAILLLPAVRAFEQIKALETV